MRPLPFCRWSDSQNGEITCAAAEITNQNEFVMIERALVEKCGRDWLVFENHWANSRLRKSTRQPVECELVVVFGVGVRVSNGTADRDRSIEPAYLVFRLSPDITQHDCNKVFERKLLSVHIRSCEQPAGKKRLQRLDQSSFFIRGEIPLDRNRAANPRNARLKVQDRSISLGHS